MKWNLLVVLLFWAPSCVFCQTELHLKKENGVLKIPCKLNGLSLDFIFDTGASGVSVPRKIITLLFNKGLIDSSAFISEEYVRDATGTINKVDVFSIKNLEFGNYRVNNVKAYVIDNDNAPLLLGQSVLESLGTIWIDFAKPSVFIRDNIFSKFEINSNWVDKINKEEALDFYKRLLFNIENHVDFNSINQENGLLDSAMILFQSFNHLQHIDSLTFILFYRYSIRENGNFSNWIKYQTAALYYLTDSLYYDKMILKRAGAYLLSAESELFLSDIKFLIDKKGYYYLEALQFLASVQWRSEEYIESLKNYDELIKVPLSTYGSFYLGEGKVDKISVRQKIYINRARVKKDLGDYVSALKDLDRALALKTINEKIVMKNIYVLKYELDFNSKAFERAIQDANILINLYPNDCNNFIKRGVARYNAKLFDQACADFRKSGSLYCEEAFKLIREYCK